jgi:hypothetical protein
MMKAGGAYRRRPLLNTRDETTLRITYARGPRPGFCLRMDLVSSFPLCHVFPSIVLSAGIGTVQP